MSRYTSHPLSSSRKRTKNRDLFTLPVGKPPRSRTIGPKGASRDVDHEDETDALIWETDDQDLDRIAVELRRSIAATTSPRSQEGAPVVPKKALPPKSFTHPSSPAKQQSQLKLPKLTPVLDIVGADAICPSVEKRPANWATMAKVGATLTVVYVYFWISSIFWKN
jgi:hypothetical protein